jgi:hypothetical protein
MTTIIICELNIVKRPAVSNVCISEDNRWTVKIASLWLLIHIRVKKRAVLIYGIPVLRPGYGTFPVNVIKALHSSQTCVIMKNWAITVAARSKAWTVFARSNAGIVVSNPTQGMDVCVCVYFVFVLSCVLVAALRWAHHSSKESHRLRKKMIMIRKRPGPCKGCRAYEGGGGEYEKLTQIIKRTLRIRIRITFTNCFNGRTYGQEEPGLRSRYSDGPRTSSSPDSVKNFLFSTSSRPAVGWSTQPPIQWVPGSLSPGLKRPGREADHSPPATRSRKCGWIGNWTYWPLIQSACIYKQYSAITNLHIYTIYSSPLHMR